MEESRVASISEQVQKSGDSKTDNWCNETKEVQEIQERKESNLKPIFYCLLVAKYPTASFVLSLSGHLLLVGLTGILVLVGYNLFPADFQHMPLELRNSDIRQRDLAWKHRDSYTGHIQRHLTGVELAPKVDPRVSSLMLFYHIDGGNVFTAENLKIIRHIEEQLFNVKAYQKRYCQMNFRGHCSKPFSVLRFFDGTFRLIDPVFNDPNFTRVAQVLFAASQRNRTKVSLSFFQGKESVISRQRAYSSITRSLLILGFEERQNETEQEVQDKLQKFLVEEIAPRLEELKKEAGQIELVYYNQLLFLHDVMKQAVYDMIFAVGSFCFIFGYMWFHTGSLWLTTWAVLSILTSFCGTNLIYRILLDFHYFGYFHILSIYIVLGIGADDIFVFYDSWKATGCHRYPSLAHRLSDAYRKSALSMFITSLTTMIAFFSNALSPLLASKSFGIFSGILVFINYISVIVFFPTVVVVYHVKFESLSCACRQETTGGSPELNAPSGQTKRAEWKEPKNSKIITFFKGPYFRFITNNLVRGSLILIFLASVGFFAYQTSFLKSDNEELQLYKSSHNYGKARKYRLHSFKPSENKPTVTIYLAWGLKNQDLSGCDMSAVQCDGHEIYDDTFDINQPRAQLAMKSFCDTIFNFTDEELSFYKIRKHPISGEPEVACFPRNLEAFLEKEQGQLGINLLLPWNRNKTFQFMKAKKHFYNVSNVNDTFDRYLEIAISYWLHNGYQSNYTSDFALFNELIGEQKDGYSKRVKGVPDTWYGNKIKYVGIAVNTTLSSESLGFSTGLPLMDKWEKFMKEKTSQMPPELQGGFQLTRMIWHWLLVQKTLVRSAVLGIIVGISLALPILVLATQNVIIGFLATLTIACITASVIAVIPLAGWKLGILVSFNMCLVVGLSVDYVVHLAEAYHLSSHSKRSPRIQEMLENMGVSVFSGACTTIGASVFMFFTQIQFFVQFGIFIFSTVGFSLIFSLGFFTSIMGFVGPQEDTGTFLGIANYFKRICFKSGRKFQIELEPRP